VSYLDPSDLVNAPGWFRDYPSPATAYRDALAGLRGLVNHIATLRNLPVNGQPARWGRDKLGPTGRAEFRAAIDAFANKVITAAEFNQFLAGEDPTGEWSGAPSLSRLLAERDRLLTFHGWTRTGSTIAPMAGAAYATPAPILTSPETATATEGGIPMSLSGTGKEVAGYVAQGAALALVGAANTKARDALVAHVGPDLPPWAQSQVAQDALLALMPALVLLSLDMAPGVIPEKVAIPARKAAALALTHAGMVGSTSVLAALTAALSPVLQGYAEAGQHLLASEDGIQIPIPGFMSPAGVPMAGKTL